MKRITVVVDKHKYELFVQQRENMRQTAEKALIDTLEAYAEFSDKPRTPKFTVVGKPKEKPKPGANSANNNITRIGSPLGTTKIKLNIPTRLCEKLAEEAKKEHIETAELIERWATERIEMSVYEVNAVTRDLFSYIGISLIEVVK